MSDGNASSPVRRNFLLAVLFLTAFSSLVYELTWTRELSYVFGSTAMAASSVLAVFMGGLALGSLLGGAILESRKRPYRFLALLELAIGVSCILTLFAIKGLFKLQPYLLGSAGEEATLGLKIFLFALSSIALIVPTFLIGVAFPAIVQLYHAQNDQVGKSVGRCYWMDTLGASLGMLVGTFLLVPALGFFKTSLLASGANILCCLLVFGGYSRVMALPREQTEVPEPERRSPSLTGKIVGFMFFLSGFAALVLEVTWIRHWGMIYGNGLHAFAIVVVSFLLGLSLGSLIYELFFKNYPNQVLLFSGIELGLGIAAVLVTAIFPHLESLFLRIYFSVSSFNVFIVSMSGICFLVLLVPTTLMGMTLPALCAIDVSGFHIGRGFGRLYAVNSVGALIGSFCAGFIIIPALGIKHSCFVAAAVYLFVGFAFLLCFAPPEFKIRRSLVSFVSIMALCAAVFFMLYKPDHLYDGVFYSGIRYEPDKYESYFARERTQRQYLRFYGEGVYGQVAVFAQGEDMVLRSNGRIDSSTKSDSRSYQTMIGHIPILIHHQPKEVLNIGLGAGWTVGGAAQHPRVRQVDSVEINPLIIEAANSFFYRFNGDVLQSKKVRSIVNDGRNYIVTTPKRYDVIISEPPEFWFSGVSALFTREFYERAYEVLNDDGIFCQWYPRYEIAERDYKVALRTISDVFPYVQEFDMARIVVTPNYQSYLVMASKQPIDFEQRLEERRKEAYNYDTPYHHKLRDLVDSVRKCLSRDDAEIEAFIENVNERNTDDLPILEFRAARDRFLRFRKE